MKTKRAVYDDDLFMTRLRRDPEINVNHQFSVQKNPDVLSGLLTIAWCRLFAVGELIAAVLFP